MSISAASIRAYRRHISPHKGFRCAYAAAHGRGSCSDLGLRLAGRVSLSRFVALMTIQAGRCRAAYVSLQSADPEREWADRERQTDKDAERQVLRCFGEGVISCCPWP